MKPRAKASTLLLGAAAAALFTVAPAQAAPPVPATPGGNCVAGYMADPNSGACWEMAAGGSPTVGGGPCMPGRLGTCMAYLANNPNRAGDTLPDSSSWP